MNVMNGCLHDYGSLNFVWNEYIGKPQKLALWHKLRLSINFLEAF